MKKETTFTAKQVGGRIKERRTELNITMPELGRRVGVNKSTIQRYEADGVDPKRTMVINGLAEALLTTPEWLTGLSDDKEYDTYTLCQRDIEEQIKKYLDTVSHTVKGEPHQQLLTTFLGKMVDLYTVMTCYFADAMEEVDRVAEDKGLKESLGRYAIESGAIMEQVYRGVDGDVGQFLGRIDGIHFQGGRKFAQWYGKRWHSEHPFFYSAGPGGHRKAPLLRLVRAERPTPACI